MEPKGTLIWLIVAATIFAISMSIQIRERRAKKREQQGKENNGTILQKS